MAKPSEEKSASMRKWVVAALKEGAVSPRKVQTWIEQKSDTTAPSLPTIALIMREEGWEPIGFVWEKKKGKNHE
jgi:hypothetical protein